METRTKSFRAASNRVFTHNEIRSLPRKLNSNGYIMCRVETGNWETEHRLVMNAMLGRPLLESESVHHRNGNRSDNRPENLELWDKTHRTGCRSSEMVRCPACGTNLTIATTV